MCSIIKNEFKIGNIWLNYHKPEAFYTSQWRCPWPVFIIYRLIVAMYSVFALIHLFVVIQGENLPHHIMTYLTVWTYCLLSLYMVCAACIAVWSNCRGRSRSQKDNIHHIKTVCSNSVDYYNPRSNDTSSYEITADGLPSLHVQDPAILDNRMPWYLKLSWLLWNIVSVVSVLVTVIYFSVLHEELLRQSGRTGISLENLNVHALNLVFVFIDTVVCAWPVRLLHVVYPIMYGLVYIIFSILYWCDDHSNVLYPHVLDWNHAGFTTGVVVVIGFVFPPIAQCCHFALYRLRLFIYKKVYKVD